MNQDTVETIKRLAAEGFSKQHVSQEVGVSRASVYRASVKHRIPFKLSSRGDHFLDRHLHRRAVQDMSASHAVEYLLNVIEMMQPAQDEQRFDRVRSMGFTPSEVMLLLAMANRQGQLMTKERLMDAVYGARVDPPEIKIVDVHICKLRKKLEKLNLGLEIKTHWGSGYSLINSNEKWPWETDE